MFASGKLFPEDLPNKKWVRFPAKGFNEEVVGVVYHAGQANCGVPLGGIGTGHVHLDTDGTLGWCTVFDSVMPPRELGSLPFLGISNQDQVCVLSTTGQGSIKKARDIHYWGHYPIADLMYQTDDEVKVNLRAWSPFLPGDANASNVPAVVFELNLINKGRKNHSGTLAITFAGTDDKEQGDQEIDRQKVDQSGLQGISVQVGERGGYFLGIIGKEQIRVGGDLNGTESGWARIARQLPESDEQNSGSSVAVDYDLLPEEEKTVRFILSWHWPILTANDRHQYVHKYASRFSNAVSVAEEMTKDHEDILNRIIAWQEVIYTELSLPEWLRDSLVNNLHLITKDGFWESNSIPPEDWARDHGMFSMVESIRTAPGQACIPSDWFGNLAIVYFFPELAHSTLKGFAHYQLPNGEIPIYFGQGYERQNPVYQLLHLTSPCNYVDLVDRLWQRSGDDAVLYEFYPSVKRAVEYLQGLDTDADGLIDCEVGALCHQFYGLWNWYGAATHVAGMWLSVLRMAERMASKVGDTSFVRNCQVWFKMGSQSLEDKLWNGNCYLLFNDTENGNKEDVILANQLTGLWSCRLHGIDDVFPANRIEKTLETVEKICYPAAKYGCAVARYSDGSTNNKGGHQSTDIFLGEIMVLANTMNYAGKHQVGTEIARQLMETIVLNNGRPWDMPGFLDNDTGEASFGEDFDQMLVLWALPASLANQTVAETVSRGGLVDRIITAASKR